MAVHEAGWSHQAMALHQLGAAQRLPGWADIELALDIFNFQSATA